MDSDHSMPIDEDQQIPLEFMLDRTLASNLEDLRRQQGIHKNVLFAEIFTDYLARQLESSVAQPDEATAVEVEAKPTAFSPNDDLDLRSCCRIHNLTQWRSTLKPGDYILVWTDGLNKFFTYRIHQIEPHQDPAFAWIRFNPLSQVIDKVRLASVYPTS